MDLYSSSLDHFPGLDLFEADILELPHLDYFTKCKQIFLCGFFMRLSFNHWDYGWAN